MQKIIGRSAEKAELQKIYDSGLPNFLSIHKDFSLNPCISLSNVVTLHPKRR